MPNNSMYVRCVSVINSCKTFEHLKCAWLYVILAREAERITERDIAFLDIARASHRNKLRFPQCEVAG